MTTHSTYKLQNGSEVQLITNPGCAPIVFLNGVIQSPNDYRIVGDKVLFGGQEYYWRPWFAWRPVTTISGRRVWLKHIYRSRGNTYVDYDNWSWYHYGDDFDVLTTS